MLTVIALVALLQAAPAAPQPPEPPAHPPVDKAVELASSFILDACMSRLDTAESAAAYGAGSAQVGQRFKIKYPETANVPVELDGGPKNDACRVTYKGPLVGALWAKFSQQPPICTIAAKSETDIAMTCPATKDSVGAAIAVHRSAGPTGEFSETLVWTGPRLP